MTGLLLAASTIGKMGYGRTEPTPDLLAGFATVLGIPAGGLAAVTDIERPAETARPNPAATSVAERCRHCCRQGSGRTRALCSRPADCKHGAATRPGQKGPR
ncbi:hypothetical protein [Actinomadura craniellae]|uniref:hypothetical protein n=1 Tax=Actinomadura craniellae TaxID=2231787 RepID=UPI0011BF359A|nr:hypothetical protein [Actinomadura craniellae]